MKTILFSALLFVSQQIHALQIQSVTVTAISSNAINVSLNTEAVEFYYFSSWQYVIAGNNITVEACFISGFGSTIAYLNNNFQIPINTLQPATYHLTVKIYYCNDEYKKLQDQISGSFRTPLREKVTFKKISINKLSDTVVFFPNPSTGFVAIFPPVYIVNVFDSNGNVIKKVQHTAENISLDELNDGFYFIEYCHLNEYRIVQIILRKR